MEKQILIAGYYGFNNSGDEAILSAMIHDLREFKPGIKIIVVSGDPSNTRKLHKVNAISLNDINAIIKNMISSDLVLLGGGGIFHDYWGFDHTTILTQYHYGIAYFSGIAFMARLLKRPLMMYAVGVGPLFSDIGKQYTRFAFEQAQLITVRDKESKNQLVNLGIPSKIITVTADPALGVSFGKVKKNIKLPSIGRPLLGVSVRNWDIGVSPGKWEQKIADALDQFINKVDGDVLFLPFQDHLQPDLNDRTVSERIRNQMVNKSRSIVAGEILSFTDKAELIRQCDLVLGMRLHSLVFAIRANVPMVALVYDEKVQYLLERINLDQQLLFLNRFTSKSLQNLLISTLNNRSEIRTRLGRERNKLSIQAHENARLALGLLKRQEKEKILLPQASLELFGPIIIRLAQFLFEEQKKIHELDFTIAEWQASLKTQMSVKDGIISEYQNELNIQKSEREKLLTEYQKNQKELSDQLLDKSREISEWKSELKSLVDERDKKIEEFQRMQKIFEHQLSEREDKIYDVQEMQKNIEHQLVESNNEIKNLKSERVVLLAEAEKKRDEAEILSQLIVEKEKETVAQTSKIVDLNDQLVAIVRSRGWILLQGLWKIRLWFVPKGSGRGELILYIFTRIRKTNTTAQKEEQKKSVDKVINISNDLGEHLHTILDQYKNRKIVVFLPTNVEWEFALFQRPQQLAIAFSRLGYLVFYCELAHTSKLSGLHQIDDGLFACNIPMDEFHILDRAIVIALSYNRNYLQYFNNPVIVYDFIDELEVFPYDLVELKKDHELLCQSASVVSATAERLLQEIFPLSSSAILCPNAVDYKHFEIARNKDLPIVKPREIRSILGLKKPIVGYYGMFTKEWFDYDLLAFIANHCQDLTFLLIGPDKDESLMASGILSLKNVIWLGVRPYSELPIYLRYFDIAIIPFKVNNITHSVSPLKLFEYFAGRKPVVITAMQESLRYTGSLVAENAIEFIIKIRQALILLDDTEYLDRIDNIARANTWDARASQIILALDKSLKKEISEPVQNHPNQRSTNQILREYSVPASNIVSDLWKKATSKKTSGLKVGLTLLSVQEKASDQSKLLFDDQNNLSQGEILDLRNELAEIHHSRYWKLLSLYWRFRNGITKQYQHMRSWFRKSIRHESRQKLVNVLRKVGIRTSNAPRLITNTPNEFSRNKVGSSPQLVLKSKIDIICLPIINWEFRFQRPQQLISQFAQNGHRCFYVRQTFHPTMVNAIINEIKNNIFDVFLPGPAKTNIYQDEMTQEIRQVLFKAMDQVRARFKITEAITLVDLPFWTPLAEKLRQWGWKIVYDCMDEHIGFSTNSKKMVLKENNLIEISDLVLTSSQALFEKVSRLSTNVLYLPNAAEFQHFNRNKYIDPLPGLLGPVIGYYGAISEWFDCQLISNIALDHPEWKFVLIGDTYGADLGNLASLKNVYLLGEIAYQSLPDYLHRFDIACIPFKRTTLTDATNPVKFYEYLSVGKPVVAVDLPELRQYSRYFYPASSPKEFEAQLRIALDENSPQLVHSRIELARQNTWLERYISLDLSIRKLYGKVMIIIVSFDNLDYLELCLDNIWIKTDYPNYEVIIVDNGSKPDVIKYLKKLEISEPRARVIYNDVNLGFARANNIGIDNAGDCDYFVLLNFDTVVTFGWLSNLLRHFKDPKVKLVGPVTNHTANEARIKVDYTDLVTMELFAEKYCGSHQNLSFEIPMLAMYCVAFRRSLVSEIGYLDERFGIGMFEDDDYSLRVRQAGGKVICVEDVFIHHWGMVSFGSMPQTEYHRLFNENRKKYEEKWKLTWHPQKYRQIDYKEPFDPPQRLKDHERK